MLVDTHTHVWAEETDRLRWKHDVKPPNWDGSFTYEELLLRMDGAGVDEAVVLTTPLYGRGPGANDYTRQALDATDRLYGVGILDPIADDRTVVRDRIERVLSHERMIGIRIHARLAYEAFPTEVTTSDWILRPAMRPFWECMTEREEAVYVFAERAQLGFVERLLSRFPGLTLVVDHLGSPDATTSPTSMPWRTITGLTSRDVYVKLSAVPRSSNEAWPYEDLHPFVTELVEQFGASRLMLGSDYPFMYERADYDQCLSWITAVESLSSAERSSLRSGAFRALVA